MLIIYNILSLWEYFYFINETLTDYLVARLLFDGINDKNYFEIISYINEIVRVNYNYYNDLIKQFITVYELTDMSFDLVTDSTMNKWYHGSQTPKGVWLDILAEVLEVNKAELQEGKELPMLKHNIELEEKYEDSKTETDLIDAILFDNGFDIRNASLIVISIGMFYLFCVLSLRFIACVFLLPFIYFIIKEAKPLNKEHDEFKKENKNVLIEILKYIKNHRTVSSVLAHYVITIVILTIIPLLEFIFYRGNFKISCTVSTLNRFIIFIVR